MELSDPWSHDWWWHEVIPGVVSTVLGGLFTLTVLAITLWWQHRTRADQAVRDEARALYERSRELLYRLMSGGGDGLFLLDHFNWIKDLISFRGFVDADEACLSVLLLATIEASSSAMATQSEDGTPRELNQQAAVAALGSAEKLLLHRSRGKSYFKMSESECEFLQKAIADGDQIG